MRFPRALFLALLLCATTTGKLLADDTNTINSPDNSNTVCPVETEPFLPEVCPAGPQSPEQDLCPHAEEDLLDLLKSCADNSYQELLNMRENANFFAKEYGDYLELFIKERYKSDFESEDIFSIKNNETLDKSIKRRIDDFVVCQHRTAYEAENLAEKSFKKENKEDYNEYKKNNKDYKEHNEKLIDSIITYAESICNIQIKKIVNA